MNSVLNGLQSGLYFQCFSWHIYFFHYLTGPMSHLVGVIQILSSAVLLLLVLWFSFWWGTWNCCYLIYFHWPKLIIDIMDSVLIEMVGSSTECIWIYTDFGFLERGAKMFVWVLLLENWRIFSCLHLPIIDFCARRWFFSL